MSQDWYHSIRFEALLRLGISFSPAHPFYRQSCLRRLLRRPQPQRTQQVEAPQHFKNASRSVCVNVPARRVKVAETHPDRPSRRHTSSIFLSAVYPWFEVYTSHNDVGLVSLQYTTRYIHTASSALWWESWNQTFSNRQASLFWRRSEKGVL